MLWLSVYKNLSDYFGFPFSVRKPIATQPLVPPITLIGLANPIAIVVLQLEHCDLQLHRPNGITVFSFQQIFYLLTSIGYV